ncbi:MFS transporter [Holophaga foetida]|uniref:MFS transporter n=1 Tax=Holophaga foetida TaxID=35839 RepID=UPI0002473727|nr:MFS transporter [Holophaga foetida]
MGRSVSITQILDDNPFSMYQVWVCALCFVIMFCEGYDMMVIGVTMPKIADFLHCKPSALGLAVSAGQLGPLIGAAALGVVADKFGRKRTLIVSTFIFAFFTYMITFITSLETLALYRFLAGIGLGGAIPNALSYGSEWAPSNKKATLATTMYAGVAVGSMATGFLAASVLPRFGWQTMFQLGGIVPVLIALVLIFLLPETLEYTIKGGDKEKLLKIVSKIAPSLGREEGLEIYSTEKKIVGSPVVQLFREGRSFTTVMIWLAFLCSFFLLWFIAAWAPSLLRKSGATPQQYGIAFACINIGSLIATLLIGRLMDKFNKFNILKVFFIVAFVSVVVFGLSSSAGLMTLSALCVVMGFFVIGGNSGCMGLATLSYPTDLRGTGIGWAYGVGKIGSLLAPAVGGMLLARQWSVSKICNVMALAALLVVVVVFVLQVYVRNSMVKGTNAAGAGAK